MSKIERETLHLKKPINIDLLLLYSLNVPIASFLVLKRFETYLKQSCNSLPERSNTEDFNTVFLEYPAFSEECWFVYQKKKIHTPLVVFFGLQLSY